MLQPLRTGSNKGMLGYRNIHSNVPALARHSGRWVTLGLWGSVRQPPHTACGAWAWEAWEAVVHWKRFVKDAPREAPQGPCHPPRSLSVYFL